VEAALEAAHICSYNGPQTDEIHNALLLRSDLHKLFDAHLLTIDASSLKVRLSPSVINSSYAEYDGRPLILPTVANLRPSPDLLQTHETTFETKMETTVSRDRTRGPVR
jgi:predicted restriction endonuclease